MIRRPPRSTRTDTLFPYTTLFRSTADRPLRGQSLTRVERWQLPPLQRDLEFGDERQQRRRLASQDRHPIIRGAVIRAMIDRHHPKDISDHRHRPSSEERRVGKETVSQCKVRWYP